MATTDNDAGNACLNISGSGLGTPLMQLLTAPEIDPGAEPSYQLCKTIYLYHPLGKKLVDEPLSIAQSQVRTITVENGPESLLVERFMEEWRDLKADDLIAMAARNGRIYGIGVLGYGVTGTLPGEDIPLDTLYNKSIFFNVWDPLNTSGSFTTNQDPNAEDFQKYRNVQVSASNWNRSRTCVFINETPIYLAYTNSAFGYTGRSVYQRALFPLKSFVQTMITDDMVAVKAGLIVAMVKQAGAIIDRVMSGASAIKRVMLKIAKTGQVLQVGHEDKIESLNLNNIDVALNAARKNILENIAASAEMPAQILNNETFAEGFGEGTEDAKKVAKYISRIRQELAALYAFMDNVTMYRAWNPDFYRDVVQEQFPEEYGSMSYEQAFTQWRGAFKAQWPNLLEEPDSEKSKVEDVKLKALISVWEVLESKMDPDNLEKLLTWFQDNLNENSVMFPHSLELDPQTVAAFILEQREKMEDAQDAAAQGTGDDQPGNGDKPPTSY